MMRDEFGYLTGFGVLIHMILWIIGISGLVGAAIVIGAQQLIVHGAV